MGFASEKENVLHVDWLQMQLQQQQNQISTRGGKETQTLYSNVPLQPL